MTFKDPRFLSNVAGAYLNGFEIGFYHFLGYKTEKYCDDQIDNFFGQVYAAINHLKSLRTDSNKNRVDGCINNYLLAIDIEEDEKILIPILV